MEKWYAISVEGVETWIHDGGCLCLKGETKMFIQEFRDGGTLEGVTGAMFRWIILYMLSHFLRKNFIIT